MSQIKSFTWTDLLIVFGVFVIGFVFAMVLNSYGRIKKEKIDEISKKFQGLNEEYESVKVKMESTVRWRYRVKFTEKILYILLLSIAFLMYKSPSLL